MILIRQINFAGADVALHRSAGKIENQNEKRNSDQNGEKLDQNIKQKSSQNGAKLEPRSCEGWLGA